MSYLRLLFWLKWKLMWRGYRRSTSATVGVILAILVFLPLSLGIAVGCAFGFRALEPPYNEQMLRAVLLGIYLFWVLVPLLGYALSDSYDITKLLLYPLSARQLFTGAILGSLIDFPVLLLLPTLLAVLVGFTVGPLSLILALPALALFLFHTLSLSQAIILASAGVLRSRRFRDIATVVIPLFWLTYYTIRLSLAQRLVIIDWRRFLHSRTWELLSDLPPGLAARSIGAAQRGEVALALGCLLVLLAFTSATLTLAGWLIERLYAGDVAPLPASGVRRRALVRQSRRQPDTVAAAGLTPNALRLTSAKLPPVVEAMADKELKYILRDPYFKIVLMNLVYMLVVVAFAFLRRREGTPFGAAEFRPGALWGVTAFVLLSEMRLSFNLFGTDGGAAATLFLFPSSRRQMLMGKNLTLFIALSAVNLVFMLILATFAGALSLFGPLFCWMELATVVFLAIGNLTSVWFPVRVVLRGWRVQQQSASRGCGYSALYLAVSAGAFLLLLPVLAALLLPTFWLSAAWYALSIPLAVAYAAGLYALSLHLAEPLLLQREQLIIARLSQEE